MSRSSIKISWSAIFALAVAGTVLCIMPGTGFAAQGGPRVFISDKVADVNGEVLTEGEMMYYLIGSHGVDVYSELADNALIADQAKPLGVSLDPGEVDALLASTYKPEELKVLQKAFGANVINDTLSTMVLARKTLRAEVDQVVKDHQINITEAMVEKTYKDNLAAMTVPAGVRFSMIEVTTKEAADSARARIVKGEAFADVAKAVSTRESNREFGGDIGQAIPKGYFKDDNAKLEDAAFALPLNDVSQPIEVEKQWYLIMPTEKTEEKVPTLEEAHPYIYARLKEGIVEPYIVEWRQSLQDTAKNDVKYPVFTDTPDPSFVAGATGSFIAPVVGSINGKDIGEGAFLFSLLWGYGGEALLMMEKTMILSQEAKKAGLEATAEEARSSLAEVYDPAKLAVLDAAFTPDVINRVSIRELSAQGMRKVQAQKIISDQNIKVSDAEIRNYFIANMEQWTRPDLVRFSVIVTDTEKDAIAARKRVTDGEDFEKVCKEVSTHVPTRSVGGDFGWVRKDGIKGEEKVLEDTAFAMETGSVSQPVQVAGSWVLVKVTDKQQKYDPQLPDMHDDIFDELMRGKIEPFMSDWERELGDKADINLVYPIFFKLNQGGNNVDAGAITGE
jgi:foldase protein PrsA